MDNQTDFSIRPSVCTVCSKSANIKSHSIAHNAWCIYTDTFNHHRHHQKTTAYVCTQLSMYVHNSNFLGQGMEEI